MSRTLFVEWRRDGFWAYDVAVGILLKHVIDLANSDMAAEATPWLAECVEQWRINAVVGDLGLHLDPDWSPEQIRTVVTLLDRACSNLRRSPSISSGEAKSWNLLDGCGILLRGESAFPTAPVVELGRAVRALLNGDLDPAPHGTWWLFGAEGGRSTIARRANNGA